MEPSVQSVDRWDSPGDPGQRGFVSPSFTAQHDEEASLTRVDDKGTERVITSGGDAGTVLGKEPGGTLSEKNAGKGPGGTPSEKNAGKEPGGVLSEKNAGKGPGGTPSEKNAGKGPGGTLSEKNAGEGPGGTPSEKNAGKGPGGTPSEKNAGKGPGGTPSEKNAGKGPGAMPSENVGKGPGGMPSEKYAGKGPSGKPSENPGKGPSGMPSEKYAGKEPCGTPSEKNAGVVEGGGSIPDLNHPGLAAPVRELPKDNDNGKPVGADKDRGDTRLLRGAANGAEASGALHSDAAPLAESNDGGEVVCVPVMDSEVEVADTVEVEVPMADILDVEVPLTESGMEVEAARVPQGVEVEMEVQVADMVEVEVPTVDSVEDVETLPMQASKSEPTVETVAMETRAAEDAPGVEMADSKEVVEDTSNVQMADSEVVVETAPAEGASNVEMADSEAAAETTAPPEETSVSASDQLAETRAGKSSKSACIQWVELADDVKDSLSEPVSDAVCSETVCQEQSAGPAVMESAATPGGAVETTPAEESCSVETTPAKESRNVETTPAEESCSVETTPAKESRNVETTPAEESCSVETTPAKESCNVETTPAKESHNVETTPAAAVGTTRVKESRNVETTPAMESRSVETTPAKESFSVETTPATESCNVETASATERCKQPEAGAEDSKMKNFGGSSHRPQFCSPDAAALSAGRETALTTIKPRTGIEGKAPDACSAPAYATNPRTSNTEDDETSPAGQAVTPSIAKVESSAGDVTSKVWPSPRDASSRLTLDAEGADRRAVKEPQEEGSGTPEKVEPQKRGEVGGVADSITRGTEVGSWGAEPAEAKKTGIAGNDVSSGGSSQKAFGVWEEIREKGDGTAERVPSLAGAKVEGDSSGVDVSKTRTKADGDDVGASEPKTKGAGDGVGTSKTQTMKESNDVGASKTQTRNDSDGVGASKTQTKKDGNGVDASKSQTKNDGDGVGASETQTQNDRSDVGANETRGNGVVGGMSKTKAKSGDGDVGTSKTKTRSGDDDAGASETKDCAREGDEGAADRPGRVDNRPGAADESGFGSLQDEDVPAQLAGNADGKKQDVAAASTSPHSDGKSSTAEKDAKEEAQPKLSQTGREDGSSSQVSVGDGRSNSAFKRSLSHERFGNIFDKFSQGGVLAKAVNAAACKLDGGTGGAREEQASNDSNLSKGSPAEPKPRCPGRAEDLKRKGRGEEQEERSSGSSYAEEQEADQQELGRGKIGDSSRTVDIKRSEHDPESHRTGHQGDVKRGECSKSKATLTVDSQSQGKNASVHKKDEAQEIKVDGNKKHSEGAQKSSDGDDKLNKNGEEADEGEDDSDEEKEVRAEKEPDENSLADSPAQKGVKSAPTSETSRADKNFSTYIKEADNEDSDEDDEVSTDKEAEVSSRSRLTPGQSKGDASSDRDADSVDFNQATQANFSDESSDESNSDDEEVTVVKHNSVDHDFIFTDGKGEEEEEREDGAEEEDNASDEKRSVHSEAADKDPGTPQFQFSRLKTCKTYSRKSELALANPDDLDVSESEESDDSDGQRASPVARAPQRSSRTRENGDVKEGAAVPASRALWKVEETRVIQDPSKSKPSIVSRITKALTSVPRNLGGAVPAASASWDISKARPTSRVSCGLQKVKTPPQTLRVRSKPLPPDPRAKPKGRQRTPRKEDGGGIGSGDRSVVGVSIKVDVFECNICGKEFNALNRYKRHERSHSSGKRFCCDVCGKLFESQDKLDIHRQVHLQSSNGTFTCPHCGEICKKWRPFLYHLSKHQADGGKKYTCQLCGHTLFSADRLRRHTKHHKQGLNFCCFTCGKLFLTQERLDTHTAVHGSSRPTKPTLPTRIPTPTPQRTAHKRSSPSPSDGKQPLPKRARAARQGGGGKDGRGVARKSPARISDSESSLSPASPSADEGSKSGASTPASDRHPAPATLAAAVDVGEVRSSSRRRSHSRKRCPCCPSSPTYLHTLSPAHHAKAKSPGGDRAERPVRPQEVGVGHKSASPRASGRKKEAPAEVGEGEVKKTGAVQYSVCLRECSVKLERSPELSAPPKRSPPVSLEPPLKTESSASASHLRTTTTTTPEKMDPLASQGKHTPKTEHPSSPSSEHTPKKPASEKSRKSASEKLKRPATDPYEGRKVKIYRTASEKLLPKNLALESASKERARRASKEKRERAAKAERPSEHRDTEERQAGASSDSQGSPKPYPCHICGKNLGSDKALKYHISDHVNAASPRQQAGTESVAHSLVYAKDLAPDKQGGYACNRCGYRTKSLADLWKHAKMHVEKGFQCKECCAAFAKPETLQHHMKAHNKGKA